VSGVHSAVHAVVFLYVS